MSDLPDPNVPHPPYDDMRAALGDAPEHHAAIDDLHAAMNESTPHAADVRASADRLRSIPALEARVANWFDSPNVQQWLFALSETGL